MCQKSDYTFFPPFFLHVGTNDDEDFPESFLLEIYERILNKEFETGKDHTHQVLEVRKKITGHGVPVSKLLLIIIKDLIYY